MEDGSRPATRQDVIDSESRLRGEMGQLRDELIEAVRDSETRLLNALYTLGESNQKRLTETERDAAGLKDRLATLESRLMAVEKRLNMPPAA